MARNDRRFARFYYDDFQRDYPDVYADADLFATWMWLLVRAEQTWPTSPELPRSVSDGFVAVLVGYGLIALGPRFTYAVKGHNDERTRRHAIAIAAANAKGAPSAVPNGAPSADPRREQDENKTSSPLPLKRGRRTNGTSPRQTGDNPRANGTSPRQEREKLKRGPSALHEILSSIQTGERR